MDQAMWVEGAGPPRILSRPTRRGKYDERSCRDGREGCLVSSTRFSFLDMPLGLSPHLTLERLIHIELADLVSTGVYLEPNWPYNGTAPSVPSATPSKSSARYKLCPDCGSLHKEIFEFRRWNEGEPNEGMEWEKIVRPVVQRWGMFVDIYV